MFVCGGLWITGAPTPFAANLAVAQDDDDDDDDNDTADAGDDDDDNEGEQRMLLDTLKDGGVVAIVILVLSFVAVGFIIEHFMSIRRSVMMPEIVMEDLERLIHEGNIDEAIEYCQLPENESVVSNVVLAGLERYKGAEFGFAEYKSAVEEAGEQQIGGMYRKTEVLALIAAISPMVGLTGTVLGMIDSFNMIASSGGMARPDQLAGGIGKALVTTLLGLVVAIPSMIAVSFFRNKIDSIVGEAGNRIERIMMPLGRQKRGKNLQ